MTTSRIPSAQTTEDGRPRFYIPVVDDPQWAAAAEAEAAGGVDADIRIFLDAQLTGADVVVDLAPGFGFVALSASTNADGTPTIFVGGLVPERLQQLQDVASADGGWLEAIEDADLPSLSALVETRLTDDSRVFLRVESGMLSNLRSALQPLVDAERLLAICVSDAATSPQWSAAANTLSALGYTPCTLVERDGAGIIVKAPLPPTSAIIALPASILGSGA